eukprot:1159679-Pelagomonas_calceolata.AAC.5
MPDVPELLLSLRRSKGGPVADLRWAGPLQDLYAGGRCEVTVGSGLQIRAVFEKLDRLNGSVTVRFG